MTWTPLLYAYGVFLLAVVSPGPDFAVTVKNSVQRGRRAGMLCALGISITNLIHITYINLGLGAVLAEAKGLFQVMELCAALYLGYLGIQSLRAKPSSGAEFDPAISTDLKKGSVRKSPLLEGMAVTALNPKAILFWLSYFTLVFRDPLPLGIRIGYLLFLVMSIFAWFSVVSLLLTQTHIRRQYLRYEMAMNRIMGALLLFLGFRVLLSLIQTSPVA
jgi:threonine/homoserine/homoserine lactone efflux protein